jgi:hypothetical protein
MVVVLLELAVLIALANDPLKELVVVAWAFAIEQIEKQRPAAASHGPYGPTQSAGRPGRCPGWWRTLPGATAMDAAPGT